MSFFGKLKTVAPPAPPKRADPSDTNGWPMDEFEEDGDTYEAPPCERPAVKVPPRATEENVYIEKSRAPFPSRQMPPPRPMKSAKSPKQDPTNDVENTYFDPENKKPPQVNRKEKPGKGTLQMELRPHLAANTKAAQSSTSHNEDDLYLDPNEGGGEGDDLYLEPQEAATSSPAPWGGVRLPLPLKGIPLLKPPVPRAQPKVVSPAVLPLNMQETETKPSPFSPKWPPVSPTFKPPLPTLLKEVKPSVPLTPFQESLKADKATTLGLMNPPIPGTNQVSRLQDMEWFAGNCDRKEAEALLFRVNKDGAFLVRHSSSQNNRQPYTLVVLYLGKVYNIPVRFLEESKTYALGKEGKKNEEYFSSLQEMISHYKNSPILLIDRHSQDRHSTHLNYPTRL